MFASTYKNVCSQFTYEIRVEATRQKQVLLKIQPDHLGHFG